MSPREDSPPLILRVTPRGIVPASAIDAEVLAGLRIGSDLQAKVLKVQPSKALRAYWALLTAIVKADDQWVTARALSNAILIKFGLVETELLLNGGCRFDPMSLRDFTDDQLWLLIEKIKLLTVTEILPGVDIEDLMRG
jgi:hypothetical protein